MSDQNVRSKKTDDVEFVVVKAKLVNLRSSASKKTDENIIDKVVSGTELQVIKHGETWTETTRGFIMSEFIERKGN